MARHHTTLSHLKTAAARVSEVLALLVEGLDVSAAVRVTHHTDLTIQRWLTRTAMHAERVHPHFFQSLGLKHLQLGEIQARLRDKTPEWWVAPEHGLGGTGEPDPSARGGLAGAAHLGDSADRRSIAPAPALVARLLSLRGTASGFVPGACATTTPPGAAAGPTLSEANTRNGGGTYRPPLECTGN